MIPFSLVLLPAFIIYRKSMEHVYETYPALYILAFGMVAAKVTNRLVVGVCSLCACAVAIYAVVVVLPSGRAHDEERDGLHGLVAARAGDVIFESVF